jgi:hypothetical protein
MGSRPRPVPSGCIDTTPADMWDALWRVDPDGQMPMPAEVRQQNGRILRFWKSFYYLHNGNQDHDTAVLPKEFWQAYWKAHPRGHHEDLTQRQYVPREEWDDAKHGYFHSKGMLVYKHPDGTMSCNGVTGVDQF